MIIAFLLSLMSNDGGRGGVPGTNTGTLPPVLVWPTRGLTSQRHRLNQSFGCPKGSPCILGEGASLPSGPVC